MKGDLHMKSYKRIFAILGMVMLLVGLLSVTCFAAETGDVAGTAYLDYRKHGQFEWTAPAILLGTLVFSLTCPLYIWNILGM